MKKRLTDRLFFKMFGIIGIILLGIGSGLILLKGKLQDIKDNKCNK